METVYSPYFSLSTFGQYGKHTSCTKKDNKKIELKNSVQFQFTSYFLIFNRVRQHHNHTTLPLIHHLPKVRDSRLHWWLGNDEALVLLVPLMTRTVKVKWSSIVQCCNVIYLHWHRKHECNFQKLLSVQPSSCQLQSSTYCINVLNAKGQVTNTMFSHMEESPCFGSSRNCLRQQIGPLHLDWELPDQEPVSSSALCVGESIKPSLQVDTSLQA